MQSTYKINRFNIERLMVLIENSQNENLRLDCIKLIKNLEIKDSKSFTFFERLFISDSNEKVREIAFKTLIANNPLKALKPVIYAINNETGSFLISLIEFLSKLDPFICKQVLIKKIHKLEKQYFKMKLDSLKLNKLRIDQLKEIVYNHQLNQSLDALYFHRHDLPLALDFYGID